MYDRTTESWWQQFLGKAIVGELTGTAVAMLPARLEAFATFGQRAPEGRVQVPPSDARAYGTNPYVGYDSAPAPFLYQGMLPKDLAPLARVVRVGDGAWSLDLGAGRRRSRSAICALPGSPARPRPRYRHDRRWQGRRQHPGRAQVRGRLGACRILGRLRVRLPCFLPRWRDPRALDDRIMRPVDFPQYWPMMAQRSRTRESTVNRIDLEACAVVVGGGQGIGQRLPSGQVEQVSLWDRDQAILEATRAELAGHGQVHVVHVDVTDLGAVEAARDAANAALGGLDILINNAGIAGPNHMLWDYPVDAWRDVIEIDLNAVFYCCRAVVPQLIAQNYGRIVNVASIAGKEGNASASAYAAAKAGVIALTKALGKGSRPTTSRSTASRRPRRAPGSSTRSPRSSSTSCCPRSRAVGSSRWRRSRRWSRGWRRLKTRSPPAPCSTSGGRATY